MPWPKGKSAHNRIVDNNGLRTCSKCGEEKPLTDYYKTGKGDNRHGSCKACFKKRVEANRPDAETRKDYYLQKGFGITLEEYSEKLNDQGGTCAICNCPPPINQRKRYLAVDHDHDTGAVRGLLCDSCNRGLGLLGDNLSTLQNAIDYLRKHEQ